MSPLSPSSKRLSQRTKDPIHSPSLQQRRRSPTPFTPTPSKKIGPYRPPTHPSILLIYISSNKLSLIDPKKIIINNDNNPKQPQQPTKKTSNIPKTSSPSSKQHHLPPIMGPRALRVSPRLNKGLDARPHLYEQQDLFQRVRARRTRKPAGGKTTPKAIKKAPAAKKVGNL